VTVRDRAGRRANRRSIFVVAPPLRPSATTLPGELPVVMRGNGMWIWQLPKTEGGNLDAIAARAAAAGISTVFVKAADGADCLIIDAETRYEGRYAAAQRYVRALRAAIGPSYPVGLTSFPYVDYHPTFPYSVFLAPGAAQANLPQVYWKAIGGSVDAVSARTVAHNRIYGAPMAPIGQAYDAAPTTDLTRFRAVWAGYGAGGISWWSWQAASSAMWATLSLPAPAAAVLPDPGWPALRLGSKGDQVIWLQQHLASFDATIEVLSGGRFTAATDAVLRAFQTARGLPATGTTDAATWMAVLALPLRPVDWTSPPG
jgi:hypothetical protein